MTVRTLVDYPPCGSIGFHTPRDVIGDAIVAAEAAIARQWGGTTPPRPTPYSHTTLALGDSGLVGESTEPYTRLVTGHASVPLPQLAERLPVEASDYFTRQDTVWLAPQGGYELGAAAVDIMRSIAYLLTDRVQYGTADIVTSFLGRDFGRSHYLWCTYYCAELWLSASRGRVDLSGSMRPWTVDVTTLWAATFGDPDHWRVWTPRYGAA